MNALLESITIIKLSVGPTVQCDTVEAILMLHYSLFIGMYHITQIITMVFPVLPY